MHICTCSRVFMFHVHFCVQMHTFIWVYACGDQRSMFYYLLPCIVRQGLSVDPEPTGSMLWPASSKDVQVSPPSARIIGMCFHALLFMWVLDVQTRVPMISLMRNALYQPSSITAPSRIFNPSSLATCQVFPFSSIILPSVFLSSLSFSFPTPLRES